MRKAIVLGLFSFLIPALLQAQPPKSFGGVWIGQSSYKDGETNPLNVGSFFFARTPLHQNLYFGYALSANTNVVVEGASGIDNSGNFFAATATGVGIHLPFEFNLAYILSAGKFNAWAGGGVNASIAQAQVYLSYADLSNGLYCEASATGKTKFAPGAQLFVGGEYAFGGIPYVGGNWGLFFQYKQMFVRKIDMDISGNAQCVDSLGNSATQRIDDTIEIDLSNSSLVLGFTYHF